MAQDLAFLVFNLRDEMKIERRITKKLAEISYVANVLDGGVVKPQVIHKTEQDRYLVIVKIAGINIGSLTAEQDENNLYIFHKMKLDGNLAIPYLIQHLAIPNDVQLDEISVTYEGNELWVSMPFNDFAGGFHKALEIKKR